MASVNMFLAPATAISATNTTTTTGNTISTTTTSIITNRARRVHTFATAAKGSGKSSEEKGFFDWLAGALEKGGFVETDPILQKVEGKSGGSTVVTGKKTTTSAAPPKKSGGDEGGFGGFGGLFSKK